jgi:LuxR family maltose regulon positive regulatory protein
MAGQARAALAALDDRQAKLGARSATRPRSMLLAEQDPAAARRELRVVLDGDVPVLSYLTQVEAHLHAFACRDRASHSRAALVADRTG